MNPKSYYDFDLNDLVELRESTSLDNLSGLDEVIAEKINESTDCLYLNELKEEWDSLPHLKSVVKQRISELCDCDCNCEEFEEE